MTSDRKHWRRLLATALPVLVFFAAVLIIFGLWKGSSMSDGNTAYAQGTEQSAPLVALFEARQWFP